MFLTGFPMWTVLAFNSPPPHNLPRHLKVTKEIDRETFVRLKQRNNTVSQSTYID